MIFYLVAIASTIILTPVTVALGKRMYFYAIEKGWKNPDQYIHVPGAILIIPALATMNLLEELTGSDLFITTNKDTSVGNWLFYVFLAGSIVLLYRIPATLQLNKFLKQVKSKSHL
jgi:hypothetical protein